jgi:hypothetical protein
MMPFDPSELLNTRKTLKKTKANDDAAAISDVIGSAGSNASDATAASVEDKAAQSNSSYASVVKSSGTAMADGGVKGGAKAKYVGLVSNGGRRWIFLHYDYYYFYFPFCVIIFLTLISTFLSFKNLIANYVRLIKVRRAI